MKKIKLLSLILALSSPLMAQAHIKKASNNTAEVKTVIDSVDCYHGSKGNLFEVFLGNVKPDQACPVFIHGPSMTNTDGSSGYILHLVVHDPECYDIRVPR